MGHYKGESPTDWVASAKLQSFGPKAALYTCMLQCVCARLVTYLLSVQNTEKGRERYVCLCVALSDRKVGDGGCIQRKDSCQGDSSEIDRMLFSSGTASVNLSASLYDSLSLLLIWPFVERSPG